jgi:hypothetical protein
MSRIVQYCDGTPAHPQRNCLDCQRIVARVRRGMTLEEAKKPNVKEDYGPGTIHPSTVRWLENAAAFFDQESDELFTATEFIRWVKPDLNGFEVPKDKTAGVSFTEGGNRTGTLAYRHTSPDPLPVMPRRKAS